jgi:small GTP-binding protein
MHIFQSPQELLLNIHTEINEEINSFIDKHDFSIYTPNVGVFGENSTGKSTFLNAMLGNKDEFKMGFGETTNKITVLYKHKKPVPPEKSGLNAKRIYKKMKYTHLDYMNLFDIPGFGQQFSHDVLSNVIQEMDIVFWFIDASTGVKKDDKLFLENIRNLDTKVIIVLNKIDAVSENNEIDDLIKEINGEMTKIKTFFKEEGVLNNLVTIFPFSATKSLVGTIRGEEGAFKIIDKIVQNVLLYTVFIESYRSCIKYLLEEDIINYEGFEYDMLNIVSETAIDLEEELKENISFGSSLNPFSSKNEEAEPIIKKYIASLKRKTNLYNINLVDDIEEVIRGNIEDLDAFKVFSKGEDFELELELLDSLDITIDLDSMAWDSFFGDSFAEEVAEKFENKITKKVQRQLLKNFERYNKNISRILNKLNKDSQNFATKLDDKLAKTTAKIQEPMLVLLLKAVQNTLDEEDNKYIGKMLKVSKR